MRNANQHARDDLTMTRASKTIGRAERIAGSAALAALTILAACSPNDILQVNNPDVIPPSDVNTPQGLSALHAGGVGDFSLAYVGNNGGIEGQILVSGSFSDELGNSETFPTRKEYDQRTIDVRNGTLDQVFRNIHNARRSAEAAAAALVEFGTTPATDPRVAESYSLAGYTYIQLGETYCSGVPVSTALDDGALEFGDPLTTTQIFTRAIARFDAALQYQANATVTNLAKVGKARTQLDLGQFAAAAATVAGVPITFAYNTTHTVALGRQQNGVFVFINQNERFSVANLDGGNGLNFRGANDPRVPWARLPATDVGFDNATPQYDQGKYASETAPLTVANGVEAELIRAEAALQAGDATTWLGMLNGLRANTALYPSAFPAGFPAQFPALQALTDPGSATGRVDLMFRERAFWLYLTGHRLGDLRRLVRQYGRTAASVFPGGGNAPYVIDGNNKGGTFGNDVNLPVPFNETNNPHFTQCLDRNA